MNRAHVVSAVVGLIALAGCASSGAPGGPSHIESALANPARLSGDAEVDTRRRPDLVLSFFAIEPGMKVLDLYSGGGYYTELLSLVVGPSGHVYSHNNQPYLAFAKDALAKRYADGRLQANVTRIMRENNDWRFPQELDAALMILAYHDIHYVDEKNGWAAIDGPKLLASLCQSLRPGGVLGIVDHVAAAGSGRQAAQDLHRLDPAIIEQEVSASGCFRLAGRSQALRNPGDYHSKLVFDPAVRGKTDRIVLKFVRN